MAACNWQHFRRYAPEVSPGDVNTVEAGPRSLTPQSRMHPFQSEKRATRQGLGSDRHEINIAAVWVEVSERNRAFQVESLNEIRSLGVRSSQIPLNDVFNQPRHHRTRFSLLDSSPPAGRP